MPVSLRAGPESELVSEFLQVLLFVVMAKETRFFVRASTYDSEGVKRIFIHPLFSIFKTNKKDKLEKQIGLTHLDGWSKTHFCRLFELSILFSCSVSILLTSSS